MRLSDDRDPHPLANWEPESASSHRALSDWIAKALPLLGSRGKAPGLLSLLYERSTSTLFGSLLERAVSTCEQIHAMWIAFGDVKVVGAPVSRPPFRQLSNLYY